MNHECNIYNLEAKFKDYLLKSNFSRTSTNNYLSDFRDFLSWFILTIKSQHLQFDIQLINTNTLHNYKNHLISRKIPVKSINRRLSSLRTFIKCAVFNGWLNATIAIGTKNVTFTPVSFIRYVFKTKGYQIFLFTIGFLSILLLFVIPGIYFASRNNFINDNMLAPINNMPGISNFYNNKIASTSADLMTIPIIDQRGNLNLSAPYPKIIGQSGTMTLEAPQLELKALEKGNITLTVSQGAIQFLFEGLTPALPYESAFYFASKDLRKGTLLHGQTTQTGDSINLLELSSGSPSETRFSVDADGNVYIKGNIILDGNLIVNPQSSIFGKMATETATSSYSPEP